MKIIIIIIVIKAEIFLTNINTVNALFVFDALWGSDQWCIWLANLQPNWGK